MSNQEYQESKHNDISVIEKFPFHPNLCKPNAPHWLTIQTKDLICVPASSSPDSSRLLQIISACVETDDVSSVISALKSFNGNLDLKLKVDHVEPLIQSLWTLIWDASFSPLVEMCAVTLIKLLKIYKRQSKADNSQKLILPWKQMYHHIHGMIFYPKNKRPVPASNHYCFILLKLINRASLYFPADSLTGVFESLRPLLYPNHWTSMAEFQSLLILMFPPASSKLDQVLLNELFSIWDIVNHSKTWDTQFMYLMSRIAVHQVGVNKEIDFFPFYDKIFNIGMNMLDLPVGSDLVNPRKTDYPGDLAFLVKKKDRMAYFAKLIIYLMFDEKSCNELLDKLEALFKSVDSFYHPSNSGRWSYGLNSLLAYLSKQYCKRLCSNPSGVLAQSSIRRRFVRLILERNLLVLFSKDSSGTSLSATTFKYISFLDPEVVFPPLLEQVVQSLETVTEAHRTVSAISALSSSCRSLVDYERYPQGISYLPTILSLIIPGIDPNDFMKTMLTLTFVSHLLMSITLVDVNGVVGVYSPMLIDGNANFDDSMGEQEEVARNATSYFEEWLISFLDRLWVVFEYLPDKSDSTSNGNGNGGYTLESSMVRFIWNTVDLLFLQLSPELHDVALKKVKTLVSDRILPNAISAVAYVCGASKGRCAIKALNAFIPLCEREIINQMDNGAGSDINSSESSVSTLIWYTQIMQQIAYQAGKDLVNFESSFRSVLDRLLSSPNRYVFKEGSKLYATLLESLSSTYPEESSSLTPEQWNDPKVIKNHFKFWGRPGDRNNLGIRWYKPGPEHVKMIMNLLELYWIPRMQTCREKAALLGNGSSTGKNLTSQQRELEWNYIGRSLHLCKLTFTGINTFLMPTNKETMLDDQHFSDESSGYESLRRHFANDKPLTKEFIQAGYCLSDASSEDYRKVLNIYREYGRFLLDMNDFCGKFREDDVETSICIVNSITAFLCNRGADFSDYDLWFRAYGIQRGMISPVKGTSYLSRHLLIKRVYLYQLLCFKKNSYNIELTPLYCDMLKTLLKLGMSRYAELRKVAQSSVMNAVPCFPRFRKVLLAEVLEVLQNPSSGLAEDLDHRDDIISARIKGALYLVSSRCFLNVCLRDLKFCRSFVKTILQLQREEKPSIQDLVRKLFLDYRNHFKGVLNSPFLFGSNVKSAIRVQVKGLFGEPSAALSSFLNQHGSKVVDRYRQNQTINDELLMDVMTIMKDGIVTSPNEVFTSTPLQKCTSVENLMLYASRLHWRYQLMATNILEMYLRIDPGCPSVNPEIFAYIVDGLIHDHPALRKLCFILLGYTLYHEKKHVCRADGSGPSKIIDLKGPVGVVQQGQVPWEFEHPELASEKDKYYIDSYNLGWYAWPSKIKVYEIKGKKRGEFPELNANLFNLLTSRLSSKTYWKRFCEYRAQEQSSFTSANAGSNHESFNHLSFQFYCRIFRIILNSGEEEKVNAAIANIFSIIESDWLTLVEEKSKQRAVSEFISGFLRAMKHLPKERCLTLWSERIEPMLRRTLTFVSQDTLSLWSAAFKFAIRKRDPRRVDFLVAYLVGGMLEFGSINFESDSFFTESRKINLARNVLHQVAWRCPEMQVSALVACVESSHSRYKQIRQQLGMTINVVLDSLWIPSSVSKGKSIKIRDQCQAALDKLLQKLERERSARKSATLTLSTAPASTSEHSKPVTTACDYVDTSKTLIYWLHDAFIRFRSVCNYDHMLPFLNSLFMMNDTDDNDLLSMASVIVNLVAKSVPENPLLVVSKLEELFSQSTAAAQANQQQHALMSWKIKISALAFIQVFAFKNIFFQGEIGPAFLPLLLNLLRDPQLEVREMSAQVISGFIRCNALTKITGTRNDGSLFDSYFLNWLTSSSQLNNNNNSNNNSKDVQQYLINRKNYSNEKTFNSALALRHASILGICSIVLAFPYTLPSFLPNLLVLLVRHLSDPNPIQASVKRTLSEFRRTHQDRWHEHVKAFTPEQLDLVSESLVSPSYYV